MDDEAKKHNQNLPGMGGVYNSFNLQLYHYAGNNPVKYTDPDGNYVVLKNKKDGSYSCGVANYIQYVTKTFTTLVPFGGYIMNLFRPISKIDSTSKYQILYNSDECHELTTGSNIIDSASLSSYINKLESFEILAGIMFVIGIVDCKNDYVNDNIIDNFMAKQDTNILEGCQTDSDAVRLCNYLAGGALFYEKNKGAMQEKGITEADWGNKIRSSTNCIYGNQDSLYTKPDDAFYNKLLEEY